MEESMAKKNTYEVRVESFRSVKDITFPVDDTTIYETYNSKDILKLFQFLSLSYKDGLTSAINSHLKYGTNQSSFDKTKISLARKIDNEEWVWELDLTPVSNKPNFSVVETLILFKEHEEKVIYKLENGKTPFPEESHNDLSRRDILGIQPYGVMNTYPGAHLISKVLDNMCIYIPHYYRSRDIIDFISGPVFLSEHLYDAPLLFSKLSPESVSYINLILKKNFDFIEDIKSHISFDDQGCILIKVSYTDSYLYLSDLPDNAVYLIMCLSLALYIKESSDNEYISILFFDKINSIYSPLLEDFMTILSKSDRPLLSCTE